MSPRIRTHKSLMSCWCEPTKPVCSFVILGWASLFALRPLLSSVQNTFLKGMYFTPPSKTRIERPKNRCLGLACTLSRLKVQLPTKVRTWVALDGMFFVWTRKKYIRALGTHSLSLFLSLSLTQTQARSYQQLCWEVIIFFWISPLSESKFPISFVVVVVVVVIFPRMSVTNSGEKSRPRGNPRWCGNRCHPVLFS